MTIPSEMYALMDRCGEPMNAGDGHAPCDLCGHDPACGFASIWRGDAQYWYCHDECHDAPTTCYEQASLNMSQWVAIAAIEP